MSQSRLDAIQEGLVVTFDRKGEHEAKFSSRFEPTPAEPSDSEGTVHWRISSRTDGEHSQGTTATAERSSAAGRPLALGSVGDKAQSVDTCYSALGSMRASADMEAGDTSSRPPHRLVKAVSVLPDVRRTQHGKLKIHVKRARNLVAMDTNGFSDPYAIVKVHSKKSFRTSMIKKTLNPDWDQFVEYHGKLDTFLRSPLTVRVYDHDVFSLNDPLGRCSIDLDPLLEHTKMSLRNIPLVGVDHGTIDVSIRFEQTGVAFAFPGPVAASAGLAIQTAVDDIPSDATCMEKARDILLNYLNSSRLMQALLVIWIVAVVVFVILLLVVFPVHVGWAPWGSFEPTLSEAEVQQAWVLVNTVLCSLFTWQNLTTLPWRLSCLIHVLPCNSRCADVGLDFYGRPTDSMFFWIPTQHRAAIVSLLILASLLQFLQQLFRGLYTSYQASEKELPGNVLIISSFAGSIVCALCGGIYQFVQLFKLHEREPETFPPSAIVMAIKHFMHAWRHGDKGCCSVMHGSLVEFHERTKEIATERRKSLALAAAGEAPAATGKAGPKWTTAEPAPVMAPAATEMPPSIGNQQMESFV